MSGEFTRNRSLKNDQSFTIKYVISRMRAIIKMDDFNSNSHSLNVNYFIYK